MSEPIWRRYARLVRPDPAGDVDAEIHGHLEQRADQLVAGGMPRPEAERVARKEFGAVEPVRRTGAAALGRQVRRAARLEAWLAWAGDVRLAVRTLRRTPGWTAVVVLTLALGIGLNSAVFSVVNAYLFRPLPYPGADRLVFLGMSTPTLNLPHELSFPDFLDYRAERDVFEALAGYVMQAGALSVEGEDAERVMYEEVTANYFTALGVAMRHGRGFAAGEDAVPGANPVLVLSHGFWRRRFAGDSGVIGRAVRIDGNPATIIGVAPPGFTGAQSLVQAHVWAPLNQIGSVFTAVMAQREASMVNVFGRLRPGVSVTRARAVVDAVTARLERDHAATNRGKRAVLVPEPQARPVLAVSGSVPRISAAFLVLTALVLAIACANVASLVLTRATVRRREIAVRAALGASRGRIVRLVLAESVVVAAAGGLLAAALAWAVTTWLAHVRIATDVPLRFDLTPDGRVFGFTFAVAVLASLGAALGPAAQVSRADLHADLKDGTRGSPSRQRLRGVLVAAEVAAALVVLTCAGLLARSTRHALRMDLGFRTDHVLLATVDLVTVRGAPARLRLADDLLARARALPGVTHAAIARRTPLGYNDEVTQVYPEGGLPGLREDHLGIFSNVVTPGYFVTMGMQLHAGRDFAASDDSTMPRVAIVNAAMAERLWPGTQAVGRRVRVDNDSTWTEVVGVVSTATWMTVGESPRPFLYLPFAQAPRGQVTLHLHTAGDPLATAPAVRRLLRELAPALPLFDVYPMADHLKYGRALLFARLGTTFATAFALLALALAAVGLFGLVSYGVTQRTQEIGVRVALGATVTDVVALVVRGGLVLVGAGAAAGLTLALLSTRLLRGLLYGVRPGDPATIGGAVLLLLVVAAIACLLPARRAARVDPVRALRAE